MDMKSSLLLGLVVIIILSFSTSAISFDNKKEYDINTKTATITNAFGMGEKLADIRLVSPLVVGVIPGKDRLVAEIELSNYDRSYNNALQKIKTYNVGSDKEIGRKFTYKYAQTSYINIPNYVTTCGDNLDEKTCVTSIDGYSKKEETKWIKFNSLSDLPEGNVRIGIFTDVYSDDNVEWIPTFFGAEISEWAVWTDNFDSDLYTYYRADENSGTTLLDFTQNNHDGTLENGATYGNKKLGVSGLYCDGTNDYVDANLTIVNGTDKWTIAFWVNGSIQGDKEFYSEGAISSGTPFLAIRAQASPNDHKYSFTIRADDGTITTINTDGTAIDNFWHHIAVVSNGTAMVAYLDGRANGTGTWVYEGRTTDAGTLCALRRNAGVEADLFKGNIDEFAVWSRNLSATEVSDLYNSGTGISPPIPKFTVNNITYESTPFETDNVIYYLNVTYNATEISSFTGTLYVDSVAVTTTTTTNTGSAMMTSNYTIPAGDYTSKKFWWKYVYVNASGSYTDYSQNYTHTFTQLKFDTCGVPTMTAPFINITFKDESTLSYINASIDESTWTAWLGDGSVTTDIVYANTTEYYSFALCSNAPSKPFKTNLDFRYSKTTHPQRAWAPSLVLTNSTYNKTLYLLSSSTGVYTQIVTQTILNQPVGGVTLTATRKISGVDTTVGGGITDGAGQLSMWLNPNFQHTIVASKAGYATNTQTITPTSTAPFTFVMTSTSGTNATYDYDLEGFRWFITPKVGTLKQGNQIFTFNATTTRGNLQSCKFEVVDLDGTVLATTTGVTNSSLCAISVTYNLNMVQRIKGRAYIQTTSSGGFILVDSDPHWVVIDLNDTTDEGLMRFFENLKNTPAFGTDINHTEYSRIVFFFIVMTLMLAIFSFFTGYELNNPGAVIILAFPIFAIGGMAGFFDLDTSNPLWQGASATFYKKYGIVIIAFFLSAGYWLNYIRRQS